MFRLAYGLGRTVAELEATLSHAEWVEWIAFHGLYDLPDAFMTVAQLGPPMCGLAGSPRKLRDLVPYFEPPPTAKPDASGREALAFLKANVPHKRRKPS